MPIINRQDAQEVGQYVDRFFAATGTGRAQALRRLFVEKLDFANATGLVSLANAPKNVALPPQAERIASMEGLHVVYAPLNAPGPDRVRKAEAAAAAKLIADTLHGDLLLVMTNPSRSQLHVIYPTFRFDKLTTSVGATPSLRRMIIERDLPRRTAVQQLSEIYHDWKKTSSIRHAVNTAFDVEAVTKQFFEEYKRVFENVMAAVVKGFGPGEAEAKKLFVQTLFNRLMFIYFLSRKGWLKFPGYSEPKDYLNALWVDYQEARRDPERSEQKNFYEHRLKPLFFAGLNNERSADLMRNNPAMYALIGDVQFLNGGLFDRSGDDKRSDIEVPDAAIDLVLRNRPGDYGLLNRFNFTVMESTPFDVEVAVDPEMLGKVFEELVTGRHESGSYYTPRPVVSFMCREALKGYLETQDTGGSSEAISDFIDHKDTGKLNLATAPKIGEALARVKVVDPACGSGAYLVGMMQELVELMTALYSSQLSHEAQDLYNLKLRIIEQNLYGADIDQFAVNIAMLRLWLSLAIDYDGPVPPPLPNLDFKIVCGDSLLGPDPSPENYGTLFQHRVHQLAGQLATLKDRHMRATGQEKSNLTADIEALQQQLREALADSAAPEEAVDWRVEFAEVFSQNSGFDIVVTNPPYGVAFHSDCGLLANAPNSYAAFMFLAVVLVQRGTMAYITPTSWETGEGYKDFRRTFFDHARLKTLVNLPYDVFATPYVDTAVTVAAFGVGDTCNTFRLATLDKHSALSADSILQQLNSASWDDVLRDNQMRIPLLNWAFGIANRLTAEFGPLGELAYLRRGIEAYQYDFITTERPGYTAFFEGQAYRYELKELTSQKYVLVSLREAGLHSGHRILTRRIVSRSNRLMSARTNSDFVCKKDLYVIRPYATDTATLLGVLGCLNSSLLSFLYLSRSTAATKDDFRQVTLAGLRELPIALPESEATRQELARLVLKQEQDPADRLNDQSIDDIIYETYGVSPVERDRIENWLQKAG